MNNSGGKMSRRIFSIFALIVLMFAGVTIATAQRTATITGVASDSSKAVIPGVAVTLRNPQTGAVLKTTTGSAGEYTFNLVPAGPGYEIQFEAAGFSPVVIKDLYLNVDDTRTQNATLKAGGAAVTVEVSAASESQTINTTDAQVGNSVEVQVLNELPVENRDSPSALFTM